MQSFGVPEAAHILGLSARQVRRYVREGFLVSRNRGVSSRDLKFDFQDLVLMRTAKRLLDEQIPSRKIRRALEALRSQLPEGHPLSGVLVSVQGDELVVRDTMGLWAPESKQACFDFSDETPAKVEAIEGPECAQLSELSEELEVALEDTLLTTEALDRPSSDVLEPAEPQAEMRCADWIDLAEALSDDRRLTQARDALRRALECDPFETEARRRLARILETEGWIERSEVHCRLARQLCPDDPDIALDHGRLLAQLGELSAALDAFETARSLDPDLREAYLGAAALYERMGNMQAAGRLLQEVHQRGTHFEEPLGSDLRSSESSFDEQG